jgi:hypothetical protein
LSIRHRPSASRSPKAAPTLSSQQRISPKPEPSLAAQKAWRSAIASLRSTGRVDVAFVRLPLLDGWQGGDRYYYHFVTDSSDPAAAAIEAGVYAPRLGNLPASGESNVFDRSALLAFSPNANGETGLANPERQGLNSTIVDGGVDPVNVFPLDPDNDRRYFNNYSPMWDAHVSQWTAQAIASGQRRAIRGFGDLRALVQRGLVTSFEGSPGEENGFVAGLRATQLIINCPVIAQPFSDPDNNDDGTPFRP